MDLLQQVGLEFVHLLGILLFASISGLVKLWRDHGRISDRVVALEKDKEILHKRISNHEAERKEEYKELRGCINQLRAEVMTLNGKLDIFTQGWTKEIK